MKKILAFAGSNSSQSINKELVAYTSSLFSNDVEVTNLDISKWLISIYSIDMDPDETPEMIVKLIDMISEYDGFILASPEHNGGTPAFLKNILDWISRRSKNVFENKPMLLMSTSPGQGGGANNLNYLKHMLPYLGAKISATFSLPSFYQNMEGGNMKSEFLSDLKSAIDSFLK